MCFIFLLQTSLRNQMPEDLLDRFFVFFRSILDQSALHGPAQIQHRTAIQCFTTDENRFLDQLARDHIERPTDITVDYMALAVGCRNRASRGAEVYSDAKSFIG